jgi:perosamine synthetase
MSKPRLALFGGEPVVLNGLPSGSTIGNAERQAVNRVIDSGELSGFIGTPGDAFLGGVELQALESEWRSFFSTPHAIAVNSATSGLHVALLALGVSPGDEVIVPPLTMSATATTVLFCGGIPRFADIEEEFYTIDPQKVERLINPSTKGIIAVNLFGGAADLDALTTITSRHNLFLLEDNAQAPAATLNQSFLGTIGNAGVFSLNRHKAIQSGEGGVIVTPHARIAERCQLIRNHGENVVDAYNITDISNTLGLNYRMTELEAAIARAQLEKLTEITSCRIAQAQFISSALTEFDGLVAPSLRKNSSHVFYFFPIDYDERVVGLPRDLFCAAVSAEGIPFRSGYVKPLYREPLYQKKIAFGNSGYPFSLSKQYETLNYSDGICPIAENIHDNRVIITDFIRLGITNEHLDNFIDAIRKVMNHRSALIEYSRP